MNQAYAVILVYSTSHAIRAEKLLQQAGIACRLIPVPRHLSSDCGVSVRILQSDETRAVQLLNTASLDYDAVHHL